MTPDFHPSADESTTSDQRGGAGFAKRMTFKKLAWLALAGFLFVGFCGLGTWQLIRLQGKLALIDKVESRAFAEPAKLPGPQAWADPALRELEYQRVQLAGQLLPEFNQYSQAVTRLGPGYWLMTPMRTRDGFHVWLNRGFVSQRQEAAEQTPAQGVQVVGLIRLSEPQGGFLRKNSPEAARWYSRDVQALSAVSGLTHAAPYFVDVFELKDQGVGSSHEPVMGLTVLKFPNNHAAYAMTWFAMALMVLAISLYVGRGMGLDKGQSHGD